MKKSNFQMTHRMRRHADTMGGIVFMQTMNAEKQKGYVYFAIRLDELEKLQKAQMAKGYVDLSEFDLEIVEEGLGLPSKHVRDRMEEEYGFNHEVITNPETPIPYFQVPTDEGEDAP